MQLHAACIASPSAYTPQPAQQALTLNPKPETLIPILGVLQIVNGTSSVSTEARYKELAHPVSSHVCISHCHNIRAARRTKPCAREGVTELKPQDASWTLSLDSGIDGYRYPIHLQVCLPRQVHRLFPFIPGMELGALLQNPQGLPQPCDLDAWKRPEKQSCPDATTLLFQKALGSASSQPSRTRSWMMLTYKSSNPASPGPTEKKAFHALAYASADSPL